MTVGPSEGQKWKIVILKVKEGMGDKEAGWEEGGQLKTSDALKTTAVKGSPMLCSVQKQELCLLPMTQDGSDTPKTLLTPI